MARSIVSTVVMVFSLLGYKYTLFCISWLISSIQAGFVDISIGKGCLQEECVCCMKALGPDRDHHLIPANRC